MYEFQRFCHLLMLWGILYLLNSHEILFVKVTENIDNKLSDQYTHCFDAYCYERSDVYESKQCIIFIIVIMFRLLIETFYENYLLRIRYQDFTQI